MKVLFNFNSSFIADMVLLINYNNKKNFINRHIYKHVYFDNKEISLENNKKNVMNRSLIQGSKSQSNCNVTRKVIKTHKPQYTWRIFLTIIKRTGRNPFITPVFDTAREFPPDETFGKSISAMFPCEQAN